MTSKDWDTFSTTINYQTVDEQFQAVPKWADCDAVFAILKASSIDKK